LLTQEIKKWNDKTALFGKNVNANHLYSIALNLEKFLEEVDKEKLNLDNLKQINEEDLAGHKQQILGITQGIKK
jgi:inactivated superfamily I helicase